MSLVVRLEVGISIVSNFEGLILNKVLVANKLALKSKFGYWQNTVTKYAGFKIKFNQGKLKLKLKVP